MIPTADGELHARWVKRNCHGLGAVKGRALTARRKRLHPLTAPARRGHRKLSGEGRPDKSTAPPAGRTKGVVEERACQMIRD